ncbi:MAG: LolA family protein [Planctomycetota bacterium]|jgi:outer membrane lipoprotein-sorting protein
MKRLIIIVLAFFAVSTLACAATCKTDKSSCSTNAIRNTHDASRTDPNKTDDILARLRTQTSQLKTYQAKINYLFIQDPEFLDSQTLRKGQLYYKFDKTGSRLRVSFETLKQDDGEDEKYAEEFIFDGVWLTRIDYQLEKVDFYQQVPEDKPIDVFEFISHRFPLVGFAKTEHLRSQFDITIIPQKKAKSNTPIGLRLIPKKDSAYKDDYKSINFWIDKKTFLPAKIGATSTEDDIFDIELLDIKVNKKIKNGVFKLETPKHFSQNRAPLKKN